MEPEAEAVIKSAPGWKFLHEELAELRKALADLRGQVVALQARVYSQEEKVAPAVSEAVLEALRAKRERDLEEMEKEVTVEASEWERSWLTR
jgi:predicted transcriptional regulator